MNLIPIFEEVLTENAKISYQEIAKEFEQIAVLFDEYFEFFTPKQDITFSESKKIQNHFLRPIHPNKKKNVLNY
jgi:hypothetical protein